MRASNARVAVAAVVLAGLLAGCGVSVTVAGPGPTGTSTSATDSPPTSSAPTTSAPTDTGSPSGDTNLPQLTLAQLDSALLSGNDVGNTYTQKYKYDTQHSTTTGLATIATVQSGDASCADVVNSFDPIATAGGVKAADYAYVYFTNNSDTNNIASEWIGAFTGNGAQQAFSTLQKDYGTCQGFRVAVGSTTSVGASQALPSDLLGASSSFGSPQTTDMILWGTQSSTSSQDYCATVVGVFGSNLAAVTGCESDIQTAASFTGQLDNAASAKLGGGGNAI